MAMSRTFECDQCRVQRSGTPHVTVTGRRLCQACHDQVTGLAAGVIAGGGVGGAIATSGWYSRLRRRRG